MRFTPTPIAGAWIIDAEPVSDARGSFARTICAQEFGQNGLATQFVQHSRSLNFSKGTLRGLHLQRAPHAEAKLIACIRGAVYDVCVDMRPDSSTFRQWFSVELTQDNARQFYLPEGCAHGFQTLADNSEIHYAMSNFYAPGAAFGYRWNDPVFAIAWPLPPTIVSPKDEDWPLLEA